MREDFRYIEGCPTTLDLFSGIAGFHLAFAAAGFSTLAFVEYEPIKQIVLKAHYPEIPIHGDIREFDCRKFLAENGRPHVITGGVPCGPASLLGKRMGTADSRWMWPDAIRLVREIRPRFAVYENPPALLTLESGRAFNGIISEMAALGYDGWWDVIPAAAFGAGHWRERLCIVFADHSSSGREARAGLCESESIGERRGRSGDVHGEALPTNANVQSGQAFSGGDSGVRGEWRNGQQDHNTESSRKIFSTNLHDARPQGHAGDGLRDGGRSGSDGSTTAGCVLPDLRNRVTGPDWWHEAVTGIPVLVPGLPGRLVEAASLCIGDSVVPQAWVPIAQALAQALQTQGPDAAFLTSDVTKLSKP